MKKKVEMSVADFLDGLGALLDIEACNLGWTARIVSPGSAPDAFSVKITTKATNTVFRVSAEKVVSKDRRETCPVCGRKVRLHKDATAEAHTKCGGGKIPCEASNLRLRNFADGDIS